MTGIEHGSEAHSANEPPAAVRSHSAYTVCLPFQGLTGEGWFNLAMVAVAALCIAYSFLTYIGHGLFDYMGVDYRAFYSVAEIESLSDFAQTYDLRTLDEPQYPVYDVYANGPWRYPYLTVPAPFLPIFLLPLKALALVDPQSGFVLWSLLNFAILGAYFLHFVRHLHVRVPRMTAAVTLISFPIFWTLFFGQVNVWLVICLGEVALLLYSRSDFRAGLWLSGMLLKPQTLLLILPSLILGKRFRAMAGFGMGALILGVSSLMLAGTDGLRAWGSLLNQFASGLPASAPNTMMNWRSAVLISPGLAGTMLGTVVTVVGMAFTSLFTLRLWHPAQLHDRRWVVIVIAGTYAGTLAVTWHSLVHMSAPLVFLLLAAYDQRTLPLKLLGAWLVAPAIIFMAIAFIQGPQPAHQWLGVFMFFLNLILVGWAAYVAPKPRGILARSPKAVG